MQLRRILCAVDFSEASRSALHVAVELARKMQAQLLLLYVAAHDEHDGTPNEPRLDAWRTEARMRGAANVSTRLACGSAWNEIVSVARADRSIDLIVIGSRASGEPVTASTAESIAHHAPCSLMIVRSRDS